MKTKTRKALRNTAIAAGVIIVLAALHVCYVNVTAAKIPHHFATAEEGCERMLANTMYYDNMTQNDIEYRLRKSGATKDELLEASRRSVRDFSLIEKYYLNCRIAKMQRKLQKNGYELPPLEEIVYIKADMSLESGATGYTHGTEIYLNSGSVKVYTLGGFIPGFSRYLDEVLWHELFHCLTRCNPDFRAEMYKLIHFTATGSDFEIPPSVREKFISNPDVEHHDAYATFLIDGQEKDCFLALITPQTYAESHGSFLDVDTVALVPTDGTDTYYTVEQASNFDEVLGTNTTYTVDPEECMADNFAYAMLYGMKGKNGQGYPNPEIIQGVIDAVSP